MFYSRFFFLKLRCIDVKMENGMSDSFVVRYYENYSRDKEMKWNNAKFFRLSDYSCVYFLY